VSLGGDEIGLGVALHRLDLRRQLGHREAEGGDYQLQLLAVLLGAPAGEHVVDGVDRASPLRRDQLLARPDQRLDLPARHVLEHRDRVDGGDPLAQRLARRELLAHEAQVWEGGAVALELARAIAAAVVGVDHGDVVAEPREHPGDEGFPGADLDDAGATLDLAEHGLDGPAAL
jgi:hypothetical protein